MDKEKNIYDYSYGENTYKILWVNSEYKIKEVKQRLERMEKMIIGGAFGIVVALLLNMLK